MMSVETGQPSAYFPLRVNYSRSQEANSSVVPIRFPFTRNVLWESKPVGDFETLALIVDKNVVQLFIVEKSLRLAHRYAEDKHLTSFLLGSVYPKSAHFVDFVVSIFGLCVVLKLPSLIDSIGDGGICFEVDRFDPGREITEKVGENVTKCKVPTAVVPGDHIIPITVKQELLTSEETVSHTKDEFIRTMQVMESKICGKDMLTLSHIVSLKANLYCCRKQDELIITLHCGAIVPDSRFQTRPIAPIPIIPTTLARNLAGPLRLSNVEGTPKMGYLTMDETRKLLLLMESDPKVYNLPLIGIWVSGIHNVHHPYVWASCLRYFNCREIKDRLLHSSGSFLLLHYSILQKFPDFWECFLDGDENLDFELLSCRESLHLDLDDCCSKEPLCFHLTSSPPGMNQNLFDEAFAKWKHGLRLVDQNVDVIYNKNVSKSPAAKKDEDPLPSSSPHPSPTQVKTPNAPTPEESLSISFDEGPDCFGTITNLSLKKTENTKILAPGFNKKPNAKKTVSNSDSMKISRQPFRQITPQQNNQNSPSIHVSRIKPNLGDKDRVITNGENKENTSSTTSDIPPRNVKSHLPKGREETPFTDRNNKALNGHVLHQQNKFSDQNASKLDSKLSLGWGGRQIDVPFSDGSRTVRKDTNVCEKSKSSDQNYANSGQSLEQVIRSKASSFSKRNNKVQRSQSVGNDGQNSVSHQISQNPRRSLGQGTRQKAVLLSDRNTNIQRCQSVGTYSEEPLPSAKSWNVERGEKRRRYHSEDIQSYRAQHPNELNPSCGDSHYSSAPFDDDNPSVCSFTEDYDGIRIPNQSPVTHDRSNQRSPSNSKHFPRIRTSKQSVGWMNTSQTTNSNPRDTSHQSPDDDKRNRNARNENARQNFIVSGRVSASDDRQKPLGTSNNLQMLFSNCGHPQPINPDIHPNSKPASKTGRNMCNNSSSQHCQQSPSYERVSNLTIRQPSQKNCDDGTSVVYSHDNPQVVNKLIHCNSGMTFYDDIDCVEAKTLTSMPNYQPCDYQPDEKSRFSESDRTTTQCITSNDHSNRIQYGDNMIDTALGEQSPGNLVECDGEHLLNYRTQTSSQKRHNNSSSLGTSYNQESVKNDGNSTPWPSPNTCNDAPPHISPARGSNESPRHSPSYVSRHPASQTLTQTNYESVNDGSQKQERCEIIEEQTRGQQFSNNKELEEQVKRQEDMIRVLQEQVRSLLRIKEAISSDNINPPLPMTPVSSPLSIGDRQSDQATLAIQDRKNTSQAVIDDDKHNPGKVTIGVNTGASLLWEQAQAACEKPCECQRSESEQMKLDTPRTNDSPDHADVFLTPEKTETLINESQLDVQVDSTRSSTPGIGNTMVLQSISADDGILTGDQAEVTSLASVNEEEVPVKGREFYDKLLCQVKDLLSGQEQKDSTTEMQKSTQSSHVPTREVVVKATLRQLEKIKHSEPDGRCQSSIRFQKERSSVFSTHQRSLSTSFIPEHPRLNYVSMSVDDTFDEITCIDDVALKYLSDEELKRFKTELRCSSGTTAALHRSFTRTVRFGSLPADREHDSISRRNLREVDFTWNNLSFCTKDYLAKYNLVEGHLSFTGQTDDKGVSTPRREKDSPEASIEECKPPFPSPVRHQSEGSSHILDIKRLKNLPKLF